MDGDDDCDRAMVAGKSEARLRSSKEALTMPVQTTQSARYQLSWLWLWLWW